MQEKGSDQPGNEVGLQYSQGVPEEENNSGQENPLFDCQSSQEPEDRQNAAEMEGQNSPSDSVPLAQRLLKASKGPTVPKCSASGTISQAVSEPTSQNQLKKRAPDQPLDKDTKARSLFEVFICQYIYVSFVCMSSDEIETMYVCRSLP